MKTVAAFCAFAFLSFPAIAAEDQAKQHATDFAAKAAMSNTFEIQAAKIELSKGKASEAKGFAQMMLDDHGRAGPQLEAAAKADGIPLPAALNEEHKNKLMALEQSDSANLDQAYLSTQVSAHQEAVTLFEEYSAKGPAGNLKEAAAKLVPDLKKHLKHVQELTAK